MLSKCEFPGQLQNEPYFQTYISCYLHALIPFIFYVLVFKMQSNSEGIKTGTAEIVFT